MPAVTFITSRHLGGGAGMAFLAQEGQAGGDHAGRQFLARGDAQPLVVEIGAMAFLGGVRDRR